MAFLHYRFVSLYCILTWVALVVIVLFDVREVPQVLCILYAILTFMAAIPMKSFVSDAEAMKATGWNTLRQLVVAGAVGLVYYGMARWSTPSAAALSEHHNYRLFPFVISSLFYIFYVVPARLRLSGG